MQYGNYMSHQTLHSLMKSFASLTISNALLASRAGTNTAVRSSKLSAVSWKYHWHPRPF